MEQFYPGATVYRNQWFPDPPPVHLTPLDTSLPSPCSAMPRGFSFPTFASWDLGMAWIRRATSNSIVSQTDTSTVPLVPQTFAGKWFEATQQEEWFVWENPQQLPDQNRHPMPPRVFNPYQKVEEWQLVAPWTNLLRKRITKEGPVTVSTGPKYIEAGITTEKYLIGWRS